MTTRSRRDETTQVIRHHWDGRATTFDEEESGHSLVSDDQRRAWLDLLSRFVGHRPQQVLDVGCGTGFLALSFAELGHTVIGIDLSPQMIKEARRKAEQILPHIDYHVCDAEALDCADETFDLVIARHVIWNLPHPKRAVAEWLRVLRPGGRLVLIEGKWADNDAFARANARLPSRIFAGLIDAAAAVALRIGRYPRRLLNKKYRRLELELPFSGGPEASALADFLEATSVHNVKVESLMDPALWGEVPKFPRYFATGIRAPAAPSSA